MLPRSSEYEYRPGRQRMRSRSCTLASSCGTSICTKRSKASLKTGSSGGRARPWPAGTTGVRGVGYWLCRDGREGLRLLQEELLRDYCVQAPDLDWGSPDLDWGSPTATTLPSPSPWKAPSSFSRLQAGNKEGLSAHGPNFAARAGPAESPAR